MKVRYLYDHGFRFQKIRIEDNGQKTVPYPATLQEAKAFVETYEPGTIPLKKK